MSRPRIRSLKPELWQDEAVGRLGSWERLLFVGLITMADDEGRLLALPSVIQGHVFPWNDEAQKKLASWLKAIEAQKMIVSYEHNDVPYIAFRNWKRHQKITRPKESRLPAPPAHDIVNANSVTNTGSDPDSVSDSSVINHEHVSEGSTLPRGSDPIPSLRSNNNDKGTAEVDARARDGIAVVRELFDYWREKCKHPSAKLSSDRRGKIEARLKEGRTADEVRQAIDGAARGAFVNENGKRFDDIELICRAGAKFESFLELTGNASKLSQDEFLRAMGPSS